MALAVGDWLVRVGRLFVALQRWGVWLLMLPLMPVLRWLWLVPPTHKPGRYWKHLGRHPVRDETPPRPEFPTRITAGRSGRKTLVLDLDETLIHSRVTRSPSSIACDLQLEVEIDRQMCRFYVHYRPYAELFLQTVARWYDVVVFTASLQEYGNPIIDSLDPDGSLVGRRFFRDSCRHDRDRNQFLKNLTKVQPDLANVMIIDNSPGAYKMQPENAIPISSWTGSRTDDELLDLLPVLDALHNVGDVRSILSMRTPPFRFRFGSRRR